MPESNERIRKQLAALNLTASREAEIVDELAQHAEDRYQELISGGTGEPEAKRIALEEVTADLLSRELRTVERPNFSGPVVLGATTKSNLFGGIAQDLRYALRTLRKNPSFTAVAILALALGIGANTAIFSVINGILLQPLRYPDPNRLVQIAETTPDFGSASIAYPNLLDWRREDQSFSGIAAYRSNDFNFTGSGEPEQVSGEYVSANLLAVLGVKPVAGRDFAADEDRPGSNCSTIVSYGFWKGRLGGDPTILGKKLILNARSCSIVGILPASFPFSDEAQVYIPIEQWNSTDLHNRESHPGIRAIGRLKPAVTMKAAQAELSTISSRLARRYPTSNAGHGARLMPMKEDMVEAVRPTLLLLACAVGFVLIIACANVANLFLARSTGRRREIAIRIALGAERWRVVRQLLTESLLLSLAAAALGLLFAWWGTSLVLAAAPASLPRSGEIGIDLSVLLFTLMIALATGILFGLTPALHSINVNPQESLKQGTRGAGGARHRTEGVFVTVEIGLAVILLCGTGLLVQSIWRLLQVDPGFNVHNVLTTEVALSPTVMRDPKRIQPAFAQMLSRVRTIPGVQSAALTALVPLGDNDDEIAFWPGVGPQPAQDRTNSAVFYVVSANYPEVMQIPLRSGRFFTEHDDLNSPNVAVIDEVLARQIFPGQNPLGRQISLMVLGQVRIVGVAGHVRQWGLDSDDTNKIRDQIYFPLSQISEKFISAGVTGMTLVLRTGPDPLSVVPSVRSEVAGPTRDQPIYAVRTMEQIISRSLAARRFILLLLIVFAGTAVLLAATGIYAVMSYSVARRVNELGIRSALGASRQQLVALVVRQGMTMAAIGMGAGLAAAVGLTRSMASLLYGVKPTDPFTLSAVTLLLGAIALLACYIPARRAVTGDPVTALRNE